MASKTKKNEARTNDRKFARINEYEVARFLRSQSEANLDWKLISFVATFVIFASKWKKLEKFEYVPNRSNVLHKCQRSI